MKNILLLTLLSFGLATDITTKELTVQIDETTESIDISNYLDLESGYYSVHLVYIDLINLDEYCLWWGFSLEGISSTGNFSAYNDDGNANELPYNFNIESHNTTINTENSTLTGNGENEEEQNLIFDIPSDCEIDLELTLHISGRFQDDNFGLQGDLNDDVDVNIFDVIVLVNIILDEDSGYIFDVMEFIKRV